MKKLIAFILVLSIVSITYFWTRDDVIFVRVALVERGDVSDQVANTRAGTLRSCQRSKLSMPVGGTVAQLLVKNGDRVSQGQVLLQLWNRDQRARLAQSQARLLAAKLKVEEICDGAKRDERDSQRAQKLAKKNVISDDALDSAQTKAAMSAHACEWSKAEQQVATAQVELQHALLDQTLLVAPFSGIVAEINGEVGEFVTPSPPGIITPPAVDLIDDSCLYVRAPIDEVDAAAIRVGMPAKITLDAYRDQIFEGEVTRIAPYVQDYEKQARTVDVEAKFIDRSTELPFLVGYSADIEVVLKRHSKVIRIPTEAIFDSDQVLVLDNESRLQQRTVGIGLSNWTWTEITSGLAEGDKLLLSLDTPGAEAGARVEVVTTQ